jgi:CheY-like chemotaxis protein
MEQKAIDILLLDDEEDVLLVIGKFLRQQGATVLTTQESTRALELLDEHRVSVIILDVNLSAGEDGVRLMSFLRMNHPGVPIILYTGFPHEKEQIKDMLAEGAACYVNKEQPPAELWFAYQQLRNSGNQPRA